MKYKRIFSAVLVLTVILSITACNLPTSGDSGTPNIVANSNNNAAVEQAAGTIVAQTLTAGAPTITSTPQPPLESYTPTLSPTATLSPTSDVVSLVVSKDTYCREGAPVVAFKSVVIIKSGQLVEVLARNPENTSFYVRNPYDENSTCWIFGKELTLSGNAADLDIATLQPTPTPTRTPTPNVNFTLVYSSLINCAPNYALKLYIQNVGATAWQFISITGSDSVTGFAINHTSNFFDQYSGCSVTNPQDMLPAGDDTYAMNLSPGEFNYDPTGHLINLNVKLCSQDNALGTCLSKPISFTP
ncbi:MAG: hypothetical protein C0410_12030 [Anaerolinea sp.]|nr:hypothetical protein [Anaerolinea sp.]